MPTTLWFTEVEKKNNMLNDLIACGQMTLCYNLIEYAKKIQEKKFKLNVWDFLTKEDQEAILGLEQELKADWEKFKQDPYWLLDRNRKIERV